MIKLVTDNLALYLCPKCMSKAIKLLRYKLTEDLLYYIICISTCEDCYAKLAKDNLVPNSDKLWQRTIQLET